MLLRLLRRKHEKAKRKFDEAVGSALSNGKQGRVKEVLSLVELAQRLSDQHDLGLTQVESDFIKNTSYQNGLEAALNSARYWASEGEVDTALRYVDTARQYASVVKVKRDEEIAAIEQEAYKKGTEKRIYWASYYLQHKISMPMSALKDINRARLYASRAGLDISERARQLKREAATKGVEIYLRLAREGADKGYLWQFEKSKRRARRFAQMIGVDIGQQISEIEQVAYGGQAKHFIGIAQTYRREGYDERAGIWAEMAQALEAKAAQASLNRSGATIDNVVVY